MRIYEKCYKETYGEEFEAWKSDTTITYNETMDDLIRRGINVREAFIILESIIDATKEEYGD